MLAMPGMHGDVKRYRGTLYLCSNHRTFTSAREQGPGHTLVLRLWCSAERRIWAEGQDEKERCPCMHVEGALPMVSRGQETR